MKNKSMITLLVLAVVFVSLAKAQIIRVYTPGNTINESNSSSPQTMLPPYGSNAGTTKPLVMFTGGAGNGGDQGGHGGYGGTPFPAFIVMGGILSTAKESTGHEETSSSKDLPAKEDKNKPPSTPPPPEQKDEDGANNPPPHDNTDASLAEVMGMMELLDFLFEQTEDNVTLLMDLDGTLLARNNDGRQREQALRERFKQFVEKWRSRGRLRLIVVTAAPLGKGSESRFAKFQLPNPDVLIANSPGWDTHVYVQFWGEFLPASPLMPLQTPIQQIELHNNGFTINHYLSGVMRELAKNLGDLFQERQITIKSMHSGIMRDSYDAVIQLPQASDLNCPHFREHIRSLVFELYGTFAKVEFNVKKHEFTVKLPTSKGKMVDHFVSALSLSGTRVIAAGDDEIDLSMIMPDADVSFTVFLGIVVSNATRDLLDILPDSGDNPQLFRARFSNLAGVVEGLVTAMQRLLPQK